MISKLQTDNSIFEEELGIQMDFAPKQLNNDNQFVIGGNVYFDIALAATFFFDQGRTFEARGRVAELFKLYQSVAGDYLISGVDPKTSRLRKLANTNIVDIKSWLHKLGPHDDFSPTYTAASSIDSPSAFSFQALSCPDYEPDDLSYVTYSFPLNWVAQKETNFFKNFVLQSCNILQPAHGYGGLSIVLPLDGGTKFAAGIASRFRGLEFAVLYQDTEAMSAEQKIRTINWLTILSNPWIAKLDGNETLNASLGEGIDVDSYNDGIVIQAGVGPKFGDRNKNEPMELYERVAKALKKIRIDELPPIAPFSGFDEEKTKAWLARFD